MCETTPIGCALCAEAGTKTVKLITIVGYDGIKQSSKHRDFIPHNHMLHNHRNGPLPVDQLIYRLKEQSRQGLTDLGVAFGHGVE